ncbi:hypothetical protein HMPREF1583_01002 [Gardnerella vaginalis JCP8151B]|nr:hypothetical protein HMPREF1583_01002 [Gardnerella vaginalis JCP8151B]
MQAPRLLNLVYNYNRKDSELNRLPLESQILNICSFYFYSFLLLFFLRLYFSYSYIFSYSLIENKS